MDPLSIQMAMGSPPILRGQVSLSSLVGRKKKPPESSATPSPNTPTKLAKIDEDSLLTPTRINTVRTRRGFRPLSVLTNSVLFPFEFDAIRAMEELEMNNKSLTEGQEVIEDKGLDVTAQSISKSAADLQMLTALPFSNESQISLQAFLAQSSPPEENMEVVEAPFSTLYDIPAPDIGQHPAFSSNPFASRSDAPNLITTSTPEEIRKFMAQTRNSSSRFTDRTSGSSDVFEGSDKKKSIFFEKSYSSTPSPNRASTGSTDLSPLAKRQPKSRPIEIPYKIPDTPTTDEANKRAPSVGIRKLSDIFKSRSGSDKVDSTPSTPNNESPKSTLQQMEKYLRIITCSPTFPYTDNSWFPRHPNTGRMWKSRNLKCTNCLDVSCGCCGRTCCAYKAAVMALDTHKRNPEGRQRALDIIQQITMVFPYGREIPTFLQCTHSSGDGPGCGKLVCPECCGMCPDAVCADIQCRKCKKDPWAQCDWHRDLPQLAALGNATGDQRKV